MPNDRMDRGLGAPVAIQSTPAVRVRALKQMNLWMTPHDIAALSGIPLRTVKSALKAKQTRRVKSVAK